MLARRWTQLALAVLWLLDGALQLQPSMLGTGLARNIIEPASAGQPAPVAVSVRWVAHLILGWPLGFDLIFGLAQLCIGAAILYRRTLRLGLAASVAWAAAVWWFGEAAGQVTSGAANLITGAPGAVLLYAVTALLVWPGLRTSRFVGIAWAAFWGTGALLQLLPGQRGAGSVASAITSNAAMAPRWIAATEAVLGRAASGAGAWAPATVTMLFLVIAAAPFLPGTTRVAGLALGAVTACGIWLVGEGLGDLNSGQATDPNTGPLLILLALATASATSEPSAWDTQPSAARGTDHEFPAPAEPSARRPAQKWRGRAAWVLAVTAAGCAVAVAAGGHAPDAGTAMTSMKPSSSPGAGPAMPAMTQPLLVRVLGTSSARIYLGVENDGQRSYTQRTVTLPYSVTVSGQAQSVTVLAQKEGGTAGATISCAIEMDGTPMTTDRAAGTDSAVSCELDP